jgi:mannose-6-phosphate isomerase
MFYEKVWGGRRIEGYKSLPAGKQIGESWELADLGATSASGAGGGEARSVISNGPLKGKTLSNALGMWGDGLLPAMKLLKPPAGEAQVPAVPQPAAEGAPPAPPPPAAAGAFPLLIKFLDASDNLSVQVHPSAEYAKNNPGAHLKTECWYIMQAEPGSKIYKGLRPGVTREKFEAAARANDPTIVDMLGAIPATVGDCHYLPSGTPHALGKGVVVAEVQTPSDTTFRVYDWGREGRELHIDQALACINFGGQQPPVATKARKGATNSRLVTTPTFMIEEWINTPQSPGGVVPRGGSNSGIAIVIGISGRVQVVGSTIEPTCWVRAGCVGLIPAKRTGEWKMWGVPGSRWLVVTLV